MTDYRVLGSSGIKVRGVGLGYDGNAKLWSET